MKKYVAPSMELLKYVASEVVAAGEVYVSTETAFLGIPQI